MDFQKRYKTLNDNQRQAVDTINGPVMVVAGPGTGKTELLSMRAANILQQTDMLPESILCLTFTDSGAHAMRERLATIIGKDAYKVAIHTFHSFGSEVINQNGEYFYQGANFRPADELSTREIITGILSELEYTNPLASKMNGEYTHLRDVTATISDLKRSGLTSDELLQVLDANDATLDAIEPAIAELFSRRISASTLAHLSPIAHKVASLPVESLPNGITPLSTTLALSLAHAVDAATDSDSTKPITTWKNKWLTKDGAGTFVFKDRKRQEKLRAMSYVYFQYLARMQEAELFDYDDMILRVVHALEVFDELRFNLQEKYQYIMVDEFQDTNLAQMRILRSLTNNPAHEDMPNILVVGDDDQAIYSFQGADVSNILSFRTLYPRATLIPLTDNYRSGEEILETARTIITQGADRLERYIEELDKTLTAHTSGKTTVEIREATTTADERQWLVDTIATEIKNGKKPEDIAVLTRRHKEIIALLPYFANAGVQVTYERQDNVLELEPVAYMLQIARVITLLSDQHIDDADKLLPELLAHPAWGFASKDLWTLSLSSYDSRKRWIDTMETIPAFRTAFQLITNLVALAQHEPLERMLDYLIGTEPVTVTNDVDEKEAIVSPLYSYYFSDKQLADDPSAYIRYLEGIRTIRSALRDHQIASDETLTLRAFTEFVASYKQLDVPLVSIHQAANSEVGVNLMTTHKSKGLEFDTVYIPGVVDSMWGERVRTRSRLIGYPENLPLATAGDSPDERLRLFFVAATRAKQQLCISYATQDDSGKALDRASFLAPLEATPIPPVPATHEAQQAELRWYEHLTEPHQELQALLQPTLESYKLSATHLGNFLDVTRGGPEAFLIHNLLRFPQAMSPAAAYGSAMHETLQRAHAHLAATGKQRALEDILNDYEGELARHRLSSEDFEQYSQKGADALQAFLAAKYDTFSQQQKVELNFAGQQSIIGEVHLTGKLDLVDLNASDKTMVVTDYKTGHPSRNWKGSSDYEKIKLHRYRQQLMFYKLLVENSRDYSNYTVTEGVLQFVEPAKEGDIISLSASFAREELHEFRQLLEAVWAHIVNLNLPSTEGYEPNYKGILQFERDLLDNIL